MRALAAAVCVVLAGAPARATVTLTKAARQTSATIGGTVAYDLHVVRTDTLSEKMLVVHDPAPAGHQLLTVSDGTTTVVCTAVAAGPLTNGVAVTCSVGGELQVSYPDNLTNPPPVTVTYQLSASSSTNNATVTCSAAGSCPRAATASTPVTAASLSIAKTGPTTVAAGGAVDYTITVVNTGTGDAAGLVVHDALPAGLTFQSIDVRGGTFTAANLASAAQPPTSTTITLAGQALDVAPPPLPAGQSLTLAVHLRADAAAAAGTRYTNVATVTPQGGTAVTSNPPVATTVSATPVTVALSKTVTPTRAKVGDVVHYTLTLTPQGSAAGPIALTDPFDAALRIAEVKVGGGVVVCGATPQAVGAVTVGCSGDGRHLEVDLPAGGTLAAPLTVEVAAAILPSAGSEIDNTATVTAPAVPPVSASATVTIDAPTTTGASLTLTAGRVLAQKDDLVPFVAVVGVPTGGTPLPSPTLLLTPTRGLRISDVRVGALVVRPLESGNALTVPLGPLAAGATQTVTVRARINGQATPGTQTLAAAVQQDLAHLADARAVVRVVADPEFDLGTLLGEVYRDDNGNGERDRGEPGIEGVTVVMDDGLQAVTDADGRYHLAAIVPGERAVKVAAHTLPPDSRMTTDDIRIFGMTPGALIKIDFGVRVARPDPPVLRAAPPSTILPELRMQEGNHLQYRLVGQAAPGARVRLGDRAITVDRTGAWVADVLLSPGRTRLPVVTEYADGRVVVAVRDVFLTLRAGGGVIVPRAEEPRLTLRFPAGALAEPTFLVEGTATVPLAAISVGRQPLRADTHGQVAVRLRLPDLGTPIPIEVRFFDGLAVRFDHTLSAGGDFVLLVGLAEGKIGYVQRDKNLGASGFYAEGRVKLYTKGRIQGRWLLEGGIDIDSTQIDSWRDLFRGNPQQVFRNLDPDRFYTVYGDASQTTQPANSRARLFVRIQLERSELVLGNFQTGLTGVEFGRYSRAVTGGRLSFVRAATDPDAPPSTQVIVFGAWLQTARAHDELRGTGGSLYYLSHRGVVEGSEQVRIELRDRISDRPVSNGAQRATIDYEVDYLAGRVLLREPLASVAAAQALVRSSNLDGDHAYVIVDYEYIVTGDLDDATVGARATQRLGPVRVGGSFVNEFRAHGAYTLFAGDLQIDLKKYGVIIGEYAHSFGDLTAFSRSDDGGLTYADALGHQAAASQREGGAWKAEADLHAWGISLHPYARGYDQGYTDTAHAADAAVLQWGAEVEAAFWKLKLRAHYDERRYEQLTYDAAGAPTPTTASETRRDIGGEIGGQFGRVGVRVGARSERSDDSDATRTGHRTAVAGRVDVAVIPKMTLYAHGQYAFEHDGAGLLGVDNSLGALGAIATLPWDTRLQLEASYGAAGLGGLAGLRTELGKGRVIYGTVTLSQDRDDRLAATVAAGGRERLDDQHGNARATLFAEDQFRDGPLLSDGARGRAHMLTAGLDLPLAKRFLFGVTFERGEVTPSGTPLSGSQPLSRTAGTVQGSYGGERLRVQLRGELRQDRITDAAGTRDELSWLASGMITAQLHHDLTMRGKLFWSQAASPAAQTGMPGAAGAVGLARSTEATVGFAWRPSFTDRLVLLGRYTWLDEGVPAAQGQNGPLDPATGQPLTLRERAHVMSLGGEGRVVWRFSLGEKIAAKRRDEPGQGTSDWMVLWVNRVIFHMTKSWDAVAEYRLLYGPGATLTHGVSIEINRILVGHLRLGAGWNFADFSDDELRLGRGSEKGFFLRAEGFY